MTQAIPQGTSIGQIEASLDWLLSHTARFRGAILVRIYTGEGYILIEHGQPVVFFFHVGNRVIRGEAARRFFGKQDFIHATLRRYTDLELQEALALAGPEALVTGSREGAAGPLPAITDDFSWEDRQGGPEPAQYQDSGPGAIDPDLLGREPAAGTVSMITAANPLLPGKERSPESVLDRISRSPGVFAVAIFWKGSIVDSRGETSLEDLVEPAEDILLSAWEILAMLSPGPLTQITLSLFSRNATIAPFNDRYLLILTDPVVNLGQIRKLVHAVHKEEREPG